MAENNKSYRIRTTVGRESDSFLDVHLEQDYDSLEILSLKLSDKDTYKLHNSDYGIIVGRVLANGNFGVPNAKISVFIAADEQNADLKMWNLYPYTSTSTKNNDDIRYNLLPDQSVKDCHKAVGTFPHKTYLLENESLLEVYDNYYKYTTRTNNAGDYLICGVPTGMQTLHMDLDLSDCGILSQRPRDFVYKGYTIEQFENPNQFKKDENIDGLSQIFSQDKPVYVQPFWGNEDNGEEIGITRADIDIAFKFEPTCVFMGSAISDNASNGVGKKCVPTNQMGAMDELTAGEGTIEMIRKTPGGSVEEFSIKGNQVINGNGVWCYQIPMNLDYMMTDEYGNMVPTDDPEKGIPTRTRVRFRASLTDMENSSQSYYRAKYLIPNNPGIDDTTVDYNFGTYTSEDSYRDLFWNGVYTIKSYIPRFQKSKRWKSERFSGIKACNYYGGNNPMPYNNMRIKLPFMFTVLCIFVKLFIKIVALVNRVISGLVRLVTLLVEAIIVAPIRLIGTALPFFGIPEKINEWCNSITAKIVSKVIEPAGVHCTYIGDGLCPDMEGWYFAPGCGNKIKNKGIADLLMNNTLNAAIGSGDNPGGGSSEGDTMESGQFIDETSTDIQNTSSSEQDSVCLTRDVDYLVNCFEMNLAQEYRVIKFDFYNDWVNGVLFFPRWMRKVKRKKRYRFSLSNGLTTYYKDKVQGCMNSENSRVKKTRYFTQQCSLAYEPKANQPWTAITTPRTCYKTPKIADNINIFPSKCHKKQGMTQTPVFGKKSGLVTEQTTMLGQYVYYLKPCEWKETPNGRTRTLLFATDIVLLGTLNDCDENGIPQAFKYLNNSSYIMPTNLALTTMDDDSYIYSTCGGTVCSSTKKKQANVEDGVRRITPDYQSTNEAYAKTDGDQVNYGENDDPIPVTESAGITWNYSGPGQDDVPSGEKEGPSAFLDRLFGNGNKRFEFLYYPGGHFLGLSCVNSDSNIKSCVNLKRICELGATMSQRREEVRGYDSNGNPKFRYYVPTGLISNVDIETASFRSMFATLNHNKLIATERNDVTGYKKYNFRFLRPDGFDGSLGNYVHKNNSPYNTKLDNNPPDQEDAVIKDATTFFEKIFNGLWTKPDDYDPKELENTERRTVEDSVDDYYMFRLGLDTFSNKEQKKHYLFKTGGKYSMPQYENSFYFYFGLKDGATALDEFKKQFFSECESNNIMKSPSITIKETIDPDNLKGSALVTINNMVPTLTVKIKDNTDGSETGFTTENDSFYIEQKLHIEEEGLTIGHEYTIEVTDSIDQTVTKTIVFGSSAVKFDAQTVPFRINAKNEVTNRIPKNGGYIKINDDVTILKTHYKISEGEVSFTFKDRDTLSDVTFTSTHYVDDEGETWYLYYAPKAGSYNVYVNYNGAKVVIYSTTIEDNRNINLYVSCDYLAYKQDYDTANNNAPIPCCNNNNGLKGYSEESWYNGSQFSGTGVIDDWESWLMRHSYYRQTSDSGAPYDDYIYTKGDYDIAIFGQPESGSSIATAGLKGGYGGNGESFYKNDYDKFTGWTLDESYTFYPTMYLNENKQEASGVFRKAFDAMTYSDDGRAAADALNATITRYSYDPDSSKITLTYTGGDGKLVQGHGCIVVFENGVIIFPMVTSSTKMVANSDKVYQNDPGADLLNMATVYPTLRVPSMYKPFNAEIKAAVWNVNGLEISTNGDGTTMPQRIDLPASYKVEGTIHNGLTFNKHFYSGDTASEDEKQEYETYLIDRYSGAFCNTLTADTSSDWQPNINKEFGKGVFNPAYGREVSSITEDVTYIDEISYAVTEGCPGSDAMGASSGVVLTERYASEFDLEQISDSCDISSTFPDEIKVKLLNSNNNLNGSLTLYTESPISSDVEFFRTNTELFLESRLGEPLIVTDGGKKYCLGYYNENSEYDIKGAYTCVEAKGSNNDRFKYSYTNKNGEKKSKTVRTEALLRDNGVTLIHRYTLKGPYKNHIIYVNSQTDSIEKAFDNFNNSYKFDLSTKKTSGTTFHTGLNEVKTIAARYVVSQRMTVYKLWSVKSLSVMFVPSDGGLPPVIPDNTSITINGAGETITIGISAEARFEASSDADWLTIDGSSRKEFPENTTGITVTATANGGTQKRTAHIKLQPLPLADPNNPQNVEYDDSDAVIITVEQPVPTTTPSTGGGE